MEGAATFWLEPHVLSIRPEYIPFHIAAFQGGGSKKQRIHKPHPPQENNINYHEQLSASVACLRALHKGHWAAEATSESIFPRLSLVPAAPGHAGSDTCRELQDFIVLGHSSVIQHIQELRPPRFHIQAKDGQYFTFLAKVVARSWGQSGSDM